MCRNRSRYYRWRGIEALDAARRRKAERDMRFVGVLDHGKSSAWIAAREGVTERACAN